MPASFEHIADIALYRDLTPERAMELQDILASDPAVSALLREWLAVRTLLARGAEQADADLGEFVLFALYECGRADALTDSERTHVEEIAPAFRSLLAGSPGMAAVADDLRRDMEDFEAHWAAWFAEEPARQASPVRGAVAAPARPAPRARRNRIDRPARSSRTTSPGVSASASRRRVLQAGLGVLVAAFLVALVIFLSPSSPEVATIRTAPSEVRLVELPDGSSVRLLGDSRVTYSPDGTDADGVRRVGFEGRALFDIAPGAARFLLVTPDAEIAVLGTSFGAHTGADGTEVVLIEGGLRMRSRHYADDPGGASAAVTLAPGQMSRMTGGVPSDPVSVRVHERLAWTGLFVFHTTPLRDMLPVLAAQYGVRISADEALLDEQVTGRFAHEESLAGTLDIIALAIGAAVQADDEGYRLAASR